MKKLCTVVALCIAVFFACISFGFKVNKGGYASYYREQLTSFALEQQTLLQVIRQNDLHAAGGKQRIKTAIDAARIKMKGMDFWFRYLEPIAYKKVNGPLPVEWETEVFEKFEKPYKREGAGLTLAALYLDETDAAKDSLVQLMQSAIVACETYGADSITSQLNTYQHFFLCNRLFLLNLAAIYTTGFECPDTARVIPELLGLLQSTATTYQAFNEGFPATQLSADYVSLFGRTIDFARTQPAAYSTFDHYTFIKNYINPLFALNQGFIQQYRVYSKSFVDYSLNKNVTSIFDKGLYNGQNPKGIFLRVEDSAALAEIDRVGKLLFYDPMLSVNNLRSCNSCHKSTAYFSDTAVATALQLNGKDRLTRNSPTLINAKFNHLIMLDGKHISLQDQVKDVMTNRLEMGGNEKEILQKILSCDEYKKTLNYLLTLTPQETEVTMEHVISAITLYYSKFSNYYAPFDEAMNDDRKLNAAAKNGFNLFMSKAQCATCHFVPHFNGIKPPYVSSEFEVLGVPADKKYKSLSKDEGRYTLNNAPEMMNAIRTGSLRNAQYTKPYMHNGVFSTLDEVIDFYNDGGGVGHGLKVSNQTLSSDSLHLSKKEKGDLLAFMHSLNEKIVFEGPPTRLPQSNITALNKRKVGGTY